MFKFENLKNNIKEKRSQINQRIEKATFIKPTRSSPLANPMDDSVATTEEFWNTDTHKEHDDSEVINVNPDAILSISGENDSENPEKAA